VTLELTIPAPCDWINSNQREYRMEVARRVKLWRATAFLWARRCPAVDGPVRIVCTFHKTRGGRWDAGNLYPTAKAIVDGLVDAGVLVDDDNTRVIGPDMRAGDKRDKACVVVTITPTGGDA
jgi:hypothetical protein